MSKCEKRLGLGLGLGLARSQFRSRTTRSRLHISVGGSYELGRLLGYNSFRPLASVVAHIHLEVPFRSGPRCVGCGFR